MTNLDLKALRLTPVQAAKVSALIRAFNEMEMKVERNGLLGCQYKVHLPVGQNQIIGLSDRAYEDHIEEDKCSARPEFYTQPENLSLQLGTYFLCNDAWEYADVKITRVPSLKTKPDESPEQYEERIFGDILSRPSHYFIGWDRKKRTYGVRFWRSEFDLEEVYSTYVHLFRELKQAVEHDAWYRNRLACHVPAACPYLPICRTGLVSQQIFQKLDRDEILP